MTMVSYPAVSGMFYPADPVELKNMVQGFLREAKAYAKLPVPKAIIAPHAGYIYSGQVAASAYACLEQVRKEISRVVLLSPAHRYPVGSVAATKMTAFATPLGKVNVDNETINRIVTDKVLSASVAIVDEAYNLEHAIEVHLPFLQMLLEKFMLVPLLIGNAEISMVVTLLNELWDGDQTLVVVSSDLSHFYDYARATLLDRKTAEAIVQLTPKAIAPEQACGYVAIKSLLKVAIEKSLTASLVDLCNSGDTAGAKDSVVGYGAFHFYQNQKKL